MSYHFPELDPQSIAATRDVVHAYVQVLGAWTSACRKRRKHWWHSSLRPSLNGLTTGVVYADINFELELDLRRGLAVGQTSTGKGFSAELHSISPAELADRIAVFLQDAGLDQQRPEASQQHDSKVIFATAAAHAPAIANTLDSVAAAMESFRADIHEETSPIQFWPHHFDLAMLWLPGAKVPGQDPANEEYADQQMNFGFTFGDASIPEPYFYITAYPLPEEFTSLLLPAGATWHSNGFNGAVLRYLSILELSDPQQQLLKLWNTLLHAGRKNMPALAA